MLSRTPGAHSTASLRPVLASLRPPPRSSPLPPEGGALLPCPSSFTGSLPSEPRGHRRGQRAGPSHCCPSPPRPRNAQGVRRPPRLRGLWGPGGRGRAASGPDPASTHPHFPGMEPLPVHLPQEVPARLGSGRFQKGREPGKGACSWLASPRVGHLAVQTEQRPPPRSAFPDAVCVGDPGLLGRQVGGAWGPLLTAPAGPRTPDTALPCSEELGHTGRLLREVPTCPGPRAGAGRPRGSARPRARSCGLEEPGCCAPGRSERTACSPTAAVVQEGGGQARGGEGATPVLCVGSTVPRVLS